MGRRYLVTGGAGFIGSNFIRWILDREEDARVTNLDALTYAGVSATVDELDGYPGHTFIKGDIRDADLLAEVVPGHDVVVHFAAESHVDRSISSPALFLDTNVVGTGVLLDAAYQTGASRFVHISTDEVYGSVPVGFPTEDAALNPTSPYSSSKAGSDLLVHSYYATYGYDTVVTRCTNNYGPYQFPEKVIPLFVTNLIEGKKVPLYGAGEAERDWLYVEDHCAAIALIIEAGESGEIYNVGANAQLANIDLTHGILDATGRDESYIDYVEDRLGHDMRYAVDSEKVRSLGWAPEHSFEQRLASTVDWYRDNEDWWRPLKERT
ncbi:MAG: dTDP-glucose 4,6-dehydratase [Acidimicrobiia bacterium]|nr:MAG: dTDP-glucose 4,6-dehydratase [Acidimicrobiia bacterium]